MSYRWYVLPYHDKRSELLAFFCKQADMTAFLPEIEKWYNVRQVKDYVVKEFLPGHLFLTGSLAREEILQLYQSFCEQGEWEDPAEVYQLPEKTAAVLRQLFQGNYRIGRSIGDIVSSRLVVESGPLRNLEQHVIKIQRHHRFAELDISILGTPVRVPLEVRSKS